MIHPINKISSSQSGFKLIMIVISWVFLLLSACKSSKNREENDLKKIEYLNQLVADLDYFQLKQEFLKYRDGLSTTNSYYFQAIIESVFDDPIKSNEFIEKYISENRNSKDNNHKELLKTKLINHIYLSQYAEALQVNEQLQTKFSKQLDSLEVEDLKNTNKIWKALINVPPQTLVKNGDVTLPITKDMAGLSTIPVKFPAETLNFVFDTGANFSVIQRSVAIELGLKIIPSDFEVEAATGIEVKSDIAIANKMELGDIVISNAVFLVFDDDALSFPSIDYHIQGIIGFPVIRALEEIQIKKTGELFIPKNPRGYSENNMALDEYIPIVKARYKGKDLRFSFDTGAQKTALYSHFYKIYKESAGGSLELEKTKLKIGGAGGNSQHEGYILNDFELKIGNQSAVLNDIQVFENKIGNVDRLDDNLGQDFIQQFDTMIISFKHGSLLFL